MTTLKPMATMEQAWAKHDRLLAKSRRILAESHRTQAESLAESLARSRRMLVESDRTLAESNRILDEVEWVVVLTAQAIYGEDAKINWAARTVKTFARE